MVQMEIQPRLAVVVQVVRLIMLELALLEAMADFPAAGEEAVAGEPPLVVQVVMEQQER